MLHNEILIMQTNEKYFTSISHPLRWGENCDLRNVVKCSCVYFDFINTAVWENSGNTCDGVTTIHVTCNNLKQSHTPPSSFWLCLSAVSVCLPSTLPHPPALSSPTWWSPKMPTVKLTTVQHKVEGHRSADDMSNGKSRPNGRRFHTLNRRSLVCVFICCEPGECVEFSLHQLQKRVFSNIRYKVFCVPMLRTHFNEKKENLNVVLVCQLKSLEIKNINGKKF